MTRRVRVARIITRLNVGGPAIQAMLLTRHLRPLGYDTLLIAGTPGPHEGDMRALRDERDLSVTTVPALGRDISPLGDPRALVRLVRLLRAYRPDVVHTHLAKAGLLGRIAARLVGTRAVVHTFHGNVLRGYFDPIRSGIFLSLERWLAKGSTRIVAISARQAAELEALRIARPPKLVQLPLGLDLAPFRDPPRGVLRAELGLDPDRPLVGIVARLVRIKDVDLFIRAAHRVRQTVPDARFVIVGDGELRADLEAQSRGLGLSDAISFLGWRSDLPAIYADCDVVALTSRNEGTPVSLMEALAAGRAVVATAVGGVPDLLRDDYGRLVPPGRVDALAGAIVDLLQDPVRRQAMAGRGPSHVDPEHDLTTLVRRVDALYRGVMAL